MSRQSIYVGLILVGGLFGLVSQPARATIINIDDGAARSTTYLFQGQGALIDPVARSTYFWNPAANNTTTHDVTNALASDGTTQTGVNFSMSVASGVTGSFISTSRGSASTTSPIGLLNSWSQVGTYDSLTKTLDFSLTGLPTNVDYTLYVYSVNGGWAGPGGRAQNVTVVGGTAHNGISTAIGTTNSTFIEGDNYVIYTGNTGPTGQVIGTVWSDAANGSPASTYAEFNGLQISYVPEPATIGLLALGGLMILPRRVGKR